MNDISQDNSIKSSLGYNMINTSWQMKETLRKAFISGGFDINADQFAVLLRLWEEDGISQIELCQRTCKNKSNLTRILDSMEKRNLIYRETSKNDRRSFNIFLKENGKAAKNDLTSIALDIQKKLFKGISQDEAKVLEGVLIVINSNMNNYNK